MVIVFFCISGALGTMRRHPSITTKDSQAKLNHSLDADCRLFGKTIDWFPGAVVVVANDWPLIYDLNTLRKECASFGHRIVNSVKLVGGTKEDAILAFMASRSEPYAVVASSDFEFTEVTAEKRVDVGLEVGFECDAAQRLRAILESHGEEATRPLSADEVRRATVNNQMLRDMQSWVTASQAAKFPAFLHR
ncbi:hypothetical protein FG484_02630 [Burkholderia pseudomallei]|nr:hypothetical protein [Burkholderia pseudomallei]